MVEESHKGPDWKNLISDVLRRSEIIGGLCSAFGESSSGTSTFRGMWMLLEYSLAIDTPAKIPEFLHVGFEAWVEIFGAFNKKGADGVGRVLLFDFLDLVIIRLVPIVRFLNL